MEFSIVGRGWALPAASQQIKPNKLGQLISLTTDESEIRQAIGIILMTSPGERVMRPGFGCHIHELVFAPNNRETAVQAERFVIQALGMWEPRITVDRVSAQPAFAARKDTWRFGQQVDEVSEQATLLIKIDYTVKSTKDERSLVYPFYLIPGE
jgi:phage baseplate assembly protein W